MKSAILLIHAKTNFQNNDSFALHHMINKINIYFPEYPVYSISIRDKESISSLIDELVQNQINNLIVQPLFLIDGIHFQDTRKYIHSFLENFHSIYIGTPLLSEISDYINLIKQLMSQHSEECDLYLCIGHGSRSFAMEKYKRIRYIVNELSENAWKLYTLDELKNPDILLAYVKEKNITNIHLIPFVLFDGYHFHRDILSSDSFSSYLIKHGCTVTICQKCLMDYTFVQNTFLSKITDIISSFES